MDMRSVHAAAWAYYKTLEDCRKEDVRSFFDQMDADKNKTISIWEFSDFLDDQGYQSKNLGWLFQELDTDGNGALDFQELVTFFYMLGHKDYKQLIGERARTQAPNGQRRPGDQRRRRRDSMLNLLNMFNGIVSAFNSMVSLGELYNSS